MKYLSTGWLFLAAALIVAACDSDPGSTHSTPMSDADVPDASGDGENDDVVGAEDAPIDTADDVADETMTADSSPADTAPDESTADADAVDDADLDGEAPPPFATCLGRPLDHEIDDVWANPRRSELLEDMDPGHSVEDLIVTLPYSSLQVEGKFAYGVLSIDLESEWVTAFVDDCTEWVSLGRQETDSDGRAVFDVPVGMLEGPGRFEVRMVVEGDGTTAVGNLLLVPPETQFVVFDIDGTLTTSDSELFMEFFADLFGGDFVPTAYDDANAVTQSYVDAGYELVYLTGRPYWLDAVSRSWLVDEGFPLGTVHFTRTLSESVPNDGGVGAYKRDYLLGIAADHQLFRGYGNATTDIFGFREAGLSTEDIYVIGDHAGEEGTQPITSYTDHLTTVEIPPAEQPW